MQSLFSVQALTLRQLGKLGCVQVPCVWNAVSVSLCGPRALHARQLWGSNAPLVQRSAALLKHRDAARSSPYQQTRCKGYKRKKGQTGNAQEEEDEEEEDPEASDYEDELQEDPSLPKDFKDQQKAVQSLRFDLVMKTGLDIARHKIEDAFYDHKLRLNGEKLIKKSKTVKVGDTLDLIVEEDKEKDAVTLKRVVLKKIVGETNNGEKLKVLLRTWKHLQLPKQDAFRE
ncbi:mitochondrial transcription rescue factor 1 [Tachysurus fulvidraco]|uniref:mitochondrial transcription rescue factor 1 n=1 Tax=Tachysurus fulvidraco TaxID=1234273 RepID=UPI000F502AE7|nr:mitochondrial transcription rescue factor 1 [Tachysurus fulvidraco]XP_027022306.1 mitochondrial transcription rescue factor 1 [Tachysurus fulvidraco]